ncbi:DUF3368 domain-containing protein [Candidatus Woesearchaeota archaeon]|nr:DUF3368 domain-containing protein [Candidatus Woesearchaeota archaeon]
MMVSNSSPLIVLGKRGILNLLKRCFGKVLIPRSVYDEVSVKKDSPEAAALGKAIGEGWVAVENVVINRMLLTEKMGRGEKEAISLAAKHKTVLLIDDDSAKSYASILGVEAHGALYVLFLACSRKFIAKEEAMDIFDGMVANGFYISTELYSRFAALLKSL